MPEPINPYLRAGITTGKIGGSPAPAGGAQKPHSTPGESFSEILSRIKQEGELKYSAHAMRRLNERGIELTEEDLKKLETAAARAEEKGIRESLIITDKALFIVSVKNKTVVTAVEKDSENIFTNIDGAVII